jgi:rSAM/selenodomain-associated transferase 1
MSSALVIVAKEPVPGSTKTRLCPPFAPEEAAEFYRCLMLDTLALAGRLEEVEHTVAFTPADARRYFRELVPSDFRLIAQLGEDLGERLANALGQHFDQGFQRVVIMNSDGPTVPLSHLQEAFRGLDHSDVTLGPGHDGGYYLIGMKRLWPELFQEIAWSTERVVEQTLVACHSLNLTVHELAEWYDVDVEADLTRLHADLRREPGLAPQTWEFLMSC